MNFSECDMVLLQPYKTSYTLIVKLNSYKPTPRSKVRHDCLVIRCWNENKHWEIQTNRTDGQIVSKWNRSMGGVFEGRLAILTATGQSFVPMVNELVNSEKFQRSLKRRMQYTLDRAAALDTLFDERLEDSNWRYLRHDSMRKWYATRKVTTLKRLEVLDMLALV